MYAQHDNAGFSQLPLTPRRLSLAVAVVFAGAMAGCSSTPKNVQKQTPANKLMQNNNSSNPYAAKNNNNAGRTYAVQSNNSGLDSNSLDELEALLEATDMMAVEDSKMAVMRYGDVWARMRAGFRMNLDVENRRTAAQRNWFAARQTYIDRLTARASRYLYHTVAEAERRGIPTELALLPVIESSYDPGATSPAAAAGLWQFIPSTGSEYGLKQTAFYDGRRDVVQSTRAAYDFLTDLYRKLGSWEAALAGYNCGGGCVQRAMNRNAAQGLPTDFWSLRLPEETMNYVPRFLAVAQIVARPDIYGVRLGPIANRPHFRQVNLTGAISIAQALQVTGLSNQEFYELNPAFRRGQTDPQGPHVLLLPNSLLANVDEQLRKLPTLESPTYNNGWAGGSAPTVLASSAGYSTAQAEALMAGGVTATITRTPANPLSAQITRSSNSTAVNVNSNRLPSDAAALAALANQSLNITPSGRLVMPSNGAAPSNSSTNAPVNSSINSATPRLSTGEPPLSAAEQQRLLGSTAGEPPLNAVEQQRLLGSTVGEPPLSVAERQRLMRDVTASAVNPAATTQNPLTTTLTTSITNSIATTTATAPVVVAAQPVPPTTPSSVQNTTPANTPSSTASSVEPPAVVTSALNSDNSAALNAASNASIVSTTTLNANSPTSAANSAPVIDPLEGNVDLSALPNSTVLNSTVASVAPVKKIVYEQPYIMLSKPTPIAEFTAMPVVKKPTKPKGERVVYSAQAGESLSSIAKRFALNVDDVAEWNQMSANAKFKQATELYLYGLKKPTAYTVQAGDGLIAVAEKFGLSPQQLADYNNLSPTSNLLVGMRLNLFDSPANKNNRSRVVAKPTTLSYSVKSGDSLIALAARYDVSPEELAKLNNTSANRMLQLGEVLLVPAQSDNTDSNNSNSGNLAKADKDKQSDSRDKKASVQTVRYTIHRGESLKSLAQKYNISVTELAALNSIPPNTKIKAGDQIDMPDAVFVRKDVLMPNRAAQSKNDPSETVRYRIRRGDSLNSLAQKYKLDLDELAALNGIPANSKIVMGDEIDLPSRAFLRQKNSEQNSYNSKDNSSKDNSNADNRDSNSDSASSKKNSNASKGQRTDRYTIARGDTLSSIAKRHDLDPDELARLNDIPASTRVRVGDEIEVPVTAEKTSAPATEQVKSYTVRRGDTLGRVASKHGLSLAKLAELNEIPASTRIQAGDTLNVPQQGKNR